MRFPHPRRTTAFALVVLLAGGIAFMFFRRENTHLRALISADFREGCFDDRITRGELEAAGDSAVPFLRETLRRGPGPVTKEVVWLMPPERIAWIQDWISEPLANYLSALPTKSHREKLQAIHALLLLGPAAEGARSELTELAAEPTDELSATAMAALAALSPSDPLTISNYSAILNGPNRAGRFFLVGHFASVWPERPAHWEILARQLQSEDGGIRARAASALARYGPAASNAIPHLLPLLKDLDNQVRPRAAHALGLISPSHADLAVEVMLSEQQDNYNWTHGLAHQLYAALGPAAVRAEPHLRMDLARSLTNGFSAPPAFALWRVTRQASPDVVQGLTRGLDQPIQRYQLDALQGLQEIGPPASNAIPVLKRLLKAPHRTIQRSAADALESITGSSVARPP